MAASLLYCFSTPRRPARPVGASRPWRVPAARVLRSQCFHAVVRPNGTRWRENGRMLPRWAIDAFLAEGWCWGGDFSGTADPMHFQATFNRHSDAPQDQAQPASM